MVNGQYFEQNLNDFLELFSKKVQTSYSGRLRAPAVHGVSSTIGYRYMTDFSDEINIPTGNISCKLSKTCHASIRKQKSRR